MQYMWVILDRFGQASDIKFPKLVTKNTRMFQNLSLLAVHLSLILTVLKGLKVKTKYQPAMFIYSSKNSWQPMAGCKIN